MRDLDELVPTASGHVTVRDLHERVAILEHGILLLREVPDGTGDTYRTMLDRCVELAAAFDQFALVVDLSDVSVRPKAVYMDEIKRSMTLSVHVAATSPANSFMRVVAGFVLARFSNKTSSHATQADAVLACRSALAASSNKVNIQ